MTLFLHHGIAHGTVETASGTVTITARVGDVTDSFPSTANNPATVSFSGTASIPSSVVVLQDGSVILTLSPNDDGNFNGTIRRLIPGLYTFSMYAKNQAGFHSDTTTFTVMAGVGSTVSINNIQLVIKAPTPSFVPPATGQNIVTPSVSCLSLIGDINCDGKVNLIDFSIMAYWYKLRSAPPANVDLNGDGKIRLVDFSILAYHWTG